MRTLYKIFLAAVFTVSMAFLFSGNAQALNVSAKDVVVTDDGVTQHYVTSSETLNGFLQSQNIVIKLNDKMTVTTSRAVEDSNILADDVVTTVVIERGFDVNVDIDGARTPVSVTAGTPVGRLFLDTKAKIGGTLFNNADPSAILTSGQTVYFTRGSVREITEAQPIPFDTKTVDDPAAPEGTDTVAQDGAAGELDSVYSVTYNGDQEISRELVSQTVKTPPADKIIKHGTKKPDPVPENSVKGHKYSKIVNMKCTAYNAGSCGKKPGRPGYGVTATGTRAVRGTAAVDPSVIPLGTRLYVEGYGEAVAADTGVYGQHVDLYFENYSDAVRFGVKHLNVYFLTD